VSQSILERRLVDLSDRIKRLRAELAVTEEQLAFLEEERRTPASGRWSRRPPWPTPRPRDARRHADALGRQRDALVHSIATLRREQDDLLDRMSASSRPAEDRPCPPQLRRTRAFVHRRGRGHHPARPQGAPRRGGLEVVGETGRGDEAVELAAA